MAQLFFNFHSRCHVARETARVDKLSILKIGVRIDQHVLDRPILAAQFRRLIDQPLAGQQLAENLIDFRPLHMKFRHVMPNILIALIAQQVQRSLVGPKDHSIRPNLMNSFQRVLKKIAELALAPD